MNAENCAVVVWPGIGHGHHACAYDTVEEALDSVRDAYANDGCEPLYVLELMIHGPREVNIADALHQFAVDARAERSFRSATRAA